MGTDIDEIAWDLLPFSVPDEPSTSLVPSTKTPAVAVQPLPVGYTFGIIKETKACLAFGKLKEIGEAMEEYP